jgi:hypothetical protein
MITTIVVNFDISRITVAHVDNNGENLVSTDYPLQDEYIRLVKFACAQGENDDLAIIVKHNRSFFYVDSPASAMGWNIQLWKHLDEIENALVARMHAVAQQ